MSTESPLKTKAVSPAKSEKVTTVEDNKNVDDDQVHRRKWRLNDKERLAHWEEEQKAKTLIERKLTGRVKWYSVTSHYGFIERDDNKSDVFVHQSAISKSRIVKFYLRTLADNEEVWFDLVEGKKGIEAANVTGPDGTDVVGSRYFRSQLFRRRQAPKAEDKKESKNADVKEEGGGEKKKKKRRVRRSRRHSSSKVVIDGHEAKGDAKKERHPGRRSDSKTAVNKEDVKGHDKDANDNNIKDKERLKNYRSESNAADGEKDVARETLKKGSKDTKESSVKGEQHPPRRRSAASDKTDTSC